MFNTKTGSQNPAQQISIQIWMLLGIGREPKRAMVNRVVSCKPLGEIDEEELRRSEGKSKHADKIFTFLIDSYSKPIWNEEDAEYFKFSTPNAMRHFLRKYSSLYKDYRESMSNRLEETTKVLNLIAIMLVQEINLNLSIAQWFLLGLPRY